MVQLPLLLPLPEVASITPKDPILVNDRWALVKAGVPGGSTAEDYFFTLGLQAAFDHPEFLAHGIGADDATRHFVRLCHGIETGLRYDRSQVLRGFLGHSDIALIEMPPATAGAMMWSDRVGDGPTARGMQMVFPDRHGRFPWMPGADPHYPHPVYGVARFRAGRH